MDSVTTNENPEVKLHFLDYWRVIRLRRSLILVVFLLCVMTSTLLTMFLPKQYASTAQIEVQKDSPEISITHLQPIGMSSDPYWLTTQFKIIESYSILTNVIADLRLDQKLAQQNGESQWTMDDTFDYLSKKVSVDQTRMTSLIEISVRNPDAQLAAAIVNGIAKAYKDSRLEQWKTTKGAGIQALQDDLNKDVVDLGVAETNLDHTRSELGIAEFSDQSQFSDTVESENLRDWAHQEVIAEADFVEYSNILSDLTNLPHEKLGPMLATAYNHLADPELTELSYKLSDAKDKMASVAKVYGPEHDAYRSAQKVLEQDQEAYDGKVDGIVNGIRDRVEEDRNTMQMFRQREDETKKEKNELDSKYRPYYQAKDRVETLKRSVDETQRRLLDEIAEYGQPDQNVVIERNPGRPGKRPVSPKTFLIIPLGVIVGLVVGIALAFFIEYLDTSVKTIDDVERALQAPVLGVIPQNVGVLLEEAPSSPHAEAYRVLQTNILFSRKNEDWNTITVLSAGAGEGKSTTLFNLATVFAQGGRRVLVVDSDLRRPTLHLVLHTSNTIGLTDYLLKQHTLDEVIQKTKMPTLDFIPSGKLPNSALSILGSGQMKETIQELKRRYEFVFFDSPPLLGVSDASILASEMDMVLQVVQYRRYPQPMTLRAKQMILKVGGNLVGIVLNNINMSQDENYYYYSGYYEYQSQQKDQTVVEVSDAAKPAKVEIKQKY